MADSLPARHKIPGGAAYIDIGSGEPLVLVHGVGLRLEAWMPQIRAFAGHYRVIAIDLPGHGESARIDDGARLPDYVSWLRDVLDTLGVSPVNLAGHSMGALIALGLTVTQPDYVRRMALLNAVFRRDAAAREAACARAADIAAGNIDIDGPLARWFVPAGKDDEARAALETREWLSRVDPSGYATAYRAFAEGDDLYADRLGDIACPALFLTGALDPNSTPVMTRAMAAATLRARAVVVPDERHMTSLVAPAPVNAAIDAWLAEPVVVPKARPT